ncbi:hypothetical protein AB0I28_35800 [Phytomonospora sp. NPDC050363]|uniref:hypothetical protein n=1 Tax=Phytomonospora sp. NPDC050363 TaxID=3155642 RepID=UPI0033D8A60B
MDDAITVRLSRDEALVLGEWLHRRMNGDDFRGDTVHPGERVALWNLAGGLEATTAEIFAPDYPALLDAARDRLVGGGEMDEPLDAERLTALMEPYSGRWWIAGGRALSLFAGRIWREHSDVDVLVLARDLPELGAAFPGELLVEDGRTGQSRPWTGEELTPGPHTLSFAAPPPGPPVQFVLGAAEGEEWVFHRGSGRIRLPFDRLGGRAEHAGLTYLAPEVVLMFKARGTRPKDEHDFRMTVGLLKPEARRWLVSSLPPGHVWVPVTAAL